MRFPVHRGEMDAPGHVNNAEYLRYFEGSRTPAVIGEFVIVWFDYCANKPVVILTSLRAVLEESGVAN